MLLMTTGNYRDHFDFGLDSIHMRSQRRAIVLVLLVFVLASDVG